MIRTIMNEEELDRLAQEELLNEAKRGRVRAETMGALGWQKCPIPSTNKRFLTNMIRSTLEPSKKKVKSKELEKGESHSEQRVDEGARKTNRRSNEHGTNKDHKRTQDYKKDSGKKYRRQEDALSNKSRHKKHKPRLEK